MPFKTLKHTTKDGTKVASLGEKIFYDMLMDKNIEFDFQPKKILISDNFTSLSGKKYPKKYYEPDFSLNLMRYEITSEPQPSIEKITKIFIEIKGDNDKTFGYGANGSWVIDKTAENRLKYRQIDEAITKNGDIFAIVRLSNLKTPEYQGLFFDKDFQQMKKFKTQKRKDLCAKVPRIMERLELWNETKL